MQYRIELDIESSKEWIDAVMDDFDAFLQDHANCERKASAMAMSFVAKYPDRLEIIPELIETGIEELEHFKEVYEIMKSRNVVLPKDMGQDLYVKRLLDFCHSGREERFRDRLLLASLVETRGAERFRMVYEACDDKVLKDFYHRLWASEARHGEIFVKMALMYFDKKDVYDRLAQMTSYEGEVLKELPIKPALH